MTGSLKVVGAALLLATLSACGGGKSTPAPVVTPPVVTPPVPVYTISGLVTGLNGTLVLQVNGGNDLTVTGNGTTTAAVAMATALTSGASYAVTVKTQPTNPPQLCTVTGGSGTVFSNSSTGGTITGLAVTCVNLSMNFLSSTPPTGATEVSCGIAPKLVFDKSVDAATAIAANITLRTGATNQPVTISVLGAEVTVTPTSRLSRLVTYTLTASTALRGTLGEPLTAPAVVTFACDGAWGTAAAFPKDANSDASNARIAFDGNGNAFAIWNQSDNGVYNVYANRYTAGTGWGTPTTIESQTTDSYTVQIGFDGAGNAIATWLTFDGASNHVWSNRYTAGAGWGTEVQIDSLTAPDADAENPELAVDTAGNAIAVWYQFDGPSYSIWSNHYSAGSGWGTAEVIESGTGNAINPRVALDSNGNGLAVWTQNGGGRNDIWSNRYTAGSGWGTAQLIETDNTGTALSPRVKIDSNGNAIAAWYQSDGTRFNINANRYVAGTGWGTAQLIETDDSGDAQLPRLAMDAAGNTIVVWQQNDGTRYNIRSNRYIPGTGWGTATTIETDNAGDATVPWVAVDSAGNALVVWQQSDGTRTNIWANRYATTTGWSTAKRIETDDAGDALDPNVAVDATGRGLAVWEQSDGTHSKIWSNKFDY